MAPEHRPTAAIAQSIRPFHTADAEAILGILSESAEASQWPPASYVRLAGSSGGLLLVSEIAPNNRLVGLIAARQVADEAEILNLAVHPNFRRKGIASSLLLATLDRFRRSAVSRVYLELRESNLPACTLYQRHGFVLSGRRKAYYQQPTEDALCMHRKFTAIPA